MVLNKKGFPRAGKCAILGKAQQIRKDEENERFHIPPGGDPASRSG